MKARLGDPDHPLLVSVRSGARASMPGMMDTVLNLGLNQHTVQGLAKKTNNQRFAVDAYRRFITMFASVVMGMSREGFEKALDTMKQAEGANHDTDLTEHALGRLVDQYLSLVKTETGSDFPQDPFEQLRMSINAVFDSWFGDRAMTYRRLYDIPDEWGTAVNVQSMVFGNMGNTSGTGVAFTRNPANGMPTFFGECLLNAQGEDVVAGIRTPLPVGSLKESCPLPTKTSLKPSVFSRSIIGICWIWNSRFKKANCICCKPGWGSVRGLPPSELPWIWSVRGSLTGEKPSSVSLLSNSPNISIPFLKAGRRQNFQSVGKGLPAGPGAAAGRIALTPDRAVELKAKGERAILVRHETSPDDIHGMHAAEGFLTAKGGMTSHAAVVARQMGKVCIAGCDAVDVLPDGKVQFGNSDFGRTSIFL